MHKPKFVPENETKKTLPGFEIQITKSRPKITKKKKKKKRKRKRKGKEYLPNCRAGGSQGEKFKKTKRYAST